MIWDPPYMDPSNKDHKERLNHRAGRWKPSTINWRERIKRNDTRFMSKKLREEILKLIKQKMNPNGHIVQFHSIAKELWTENRAYLLIWVKSEWSGISGSPVINNGEFVNIIGPNVQKNGNTIPKYLAISEEKKNGICIVRSCAKPQRLYEMIFRLLNPAHVLDPFAGYGRSISAAIKRGIQIDACDIDPSLQFQYDSYVTNPIDNFFTEVS